MKEFKIRRLIKEVTVVERSKSIWKDNKYHSGTKEVLQYLDGDTWTDIPVEYDCTYIEQKA